MTDFSLCTQQAFHSSLCCFQVAKADLSTTEGKLAESTASLETVKADLTEKTRHASQLESQVQVAQDKAADFRADAVAAQNNLDAAEHKVAELTDSLASAQASHSQAVDELQQQHVDDIRVSFACELCIDCPCHPLCLTQCCSFACFPYTNIMNNVRAGALCFVLLVCGTVLLFCCFVSAARATNAKYACADMCKLDNYHSVWCSLATVCTATYAVSQCTVVPALTCCLTCSNCPAGYSDPASTSQVRQRHGRVEPQ